MWPLRKRAQGGEVGPSWVTPRPHETDRSENLGYITRGHSGRIGRGMASCDHCTRYFVSDTPSHAFYAWAHHQCLDK